MEGRGGGRRTCHGAGRNAQEGGAGYDGVCMAQNRGEPSVYRRFNVSNMSSDIDIPDEFHSHPHFILPDDGALEFYGVGIFRVIEGHYDGSSN